MVAGEPKFQHDVAVLIIQKFFCIAAIWAIFALNCDHLYVNDTRKPGKDKRLTCCWETTRQQHIILESNWMNCL